MNPPFLNQENSLSTHPFLSSLRGTVHYLSLTKIRDFTFQIRLELLKASKLIPPQIPRWCDCVKSIRNKFAHEFDVDSFDKLPEKLRNRLTALFNELNSGGTPAQETLREMYSKVAVMAVYGLRIYTGNLALLREEITREAFINEIRQKNEELFQKKLLPDLSDLEEGGSGILYGADHVYLIKAPHGWIFDNKSGVGQRLYAVMYPVGQTWKDSPVVIYSRAASKLEHENLTAFVKRDFEDLQRQSPRIAMLDYEVEAGPDDLQQPIVFKQLLGNQNARRELVAYIDTLKAVVMIVLSATTDQDFADSIPAFMSTVNSFHFVTDKVEMKK